MVYRTELSLRLASVLVVEEEASLVVVLVVQVDIHLPFKPKVEPVSIHSVSSYAGDNFYPKFRPVR